LAQGGDREKDTSGSDKLGVIATLSFGTYTGLAAGDSAAGQQFFATHCGACHATEPGMNKIGPSLAGVVGRKSGSAPGFNLLTRAQGGKHHVG
jgi:cytochrome c2